MTYTSVSITGTFDWPSVERWVSDMCQGVVAYTLQLNGDVATATFAEPMSEEFAELIRRMIRNNRYPFRKTYTGIFRPNLLSIEIAAIGFSVENCTTESVSVVYEMPDDSMPEGLVEQLDDVVANHNPNYQSPAEIRRAALVAAWGQYVGQPIANLQLEDLTQLVVLYLSLNTSAVAADGTINPIV